VVLLGLLLCVSVQCGLTKRFKLREQPWRIFEEATDMRPDGILQLGRFHWPT
jgi:hypothetical protein